MVFRQGRTGRHSGRVAEDRGHRIARSHNDQARHSARAHYNVHCSGTAAALLLRRSAVRSTCRGCAWPCYSTALLLYWYAVSAISR
eukprot:COSAG01_NODE_2603_length_7393_cov_39.196874_8_plen_86_part_00